MNDAIVVGGGPAGSVAAMLLARAGLQVLLLEQRTFPRAKPCGDCISPGANAILARIGALDRILAAGPAQLQGWRLSASEEISFEAGFGGETVSYAMERARLDAILLDAARDAGVDVRFNARVTDLLRTEDRVAGVKATIHGEVVEIGAPLTIGADGLRSRVARRLDAHQRRPRLRKLSLTAHVRGVPGVGPLGEMHVRPGTCLGIAPVENIPNPLFNVTVVLSDTISRQAGAPQRRNVMMRAALTRFPERDLSGLITDKTAVLASGPFDWPVHTVVHPGAVLIGDAAGYYDPFTGQGIYQAIAGAELLASHISTNNIAGFDAAYRKMLAPTRRIQRGVELVCARPALARASFRALARAPRAAARLVQVTGDLRPARDLLWFT